MIGDGRRQLLEEHSPSLRECFEGAGAVSATPRPSYGAGLCDVMRKALIGPLSELEHIFRVGLGGRAGRLCRMDDGHADNLNRSELALLSQNALGGGNNGIRRVLPGHLIGLRQLVIQDRYANVNRAGGHVNGLAGNIPRR